MVRIQPLDKVQLFRTFSWKIVVFLDQMAKSAWDFFFIPASESPSYGLLSSSEHTAAQSSEAYTS